MRGVNSEKRMARLFSLGRARTAILVIFAVVALQQAAFGGGFATATTYNVGQGPLAVVVGDFNGDGKQDLAVANSYGHNISILLGNGDGTFRTAVNYSVAGAPYSVAVGDFNRDGHLDLVAPNEGSANVSVLLGNGDGTFQPAVSYPAGQGADFVAVADFNGDGKLDLAVANALSNSVSILLGVGNGTFEPAVNYSVGANPYSLAVSDFNGDGKLDLVTTNENDNSLSILIGNGDGTFQPAVNYGVLRAPVSVAVGDLNGDNHPDLVVGYDSGTSVSVLLNNGNGTFAAGVSFDVSMTGSEVAVADFNGDGKLDVAASGDLSASAGQLSILLGNGDGTLQAPQTYALGPGPMKLVAADLNGDGAPDLAVAIYGNNTVSVLLNTDRGTPPSLSANGVVNGATYHAPVAPGSIATVFGTFSIPSPLLVTGFPVPTAIDALSLQFTGVPLAPLFSATQTQLNVQIPWELSGQTQTTASVSQNGLTSAAQTVPIATYAPGIFVVNGQTGQGAVLDAGYNLVGPANPTTAGADLMIYCTGLGPVTNQPATGAPALANPLSWTTIAPTVTMGGAPAVVLFSGLVPGAVGLYQVNVQVPTTATKGASLPLTISVGGSTSNAVNVPVE